MEDRPDVSASGRGEQPSACCAGGTGRRAADLSLLSDSWGRELTVVSRALYAFHTIALTTWEYGVRVKWVVFEAVADAVFWLVVPVVIYGPAAGHSRGQGALGIGRGWGLSPP